MRILTTAQMRELTSPANIKLLMAPDTITSYRFTSQPMPESTYGYYKPGLEIDGIEYSANHLGGLTSIGEAIFRVNNSIENVKFFASDYLENEKTFLYVMVNDTVYVIRTGSIKNWNIKSDIIEFELLDATERHDIDILKEITETEYPYAPNDVIGKFKPLVYGRAGTVFKVPAYLINEMNPTIYIANHTCDFSTIPPIQYYENSIDFFVNLVYNNIEIVETNQTYFTWDTVYAYINYYQKFILGSNTTPTYRSDFYKICDGLMSTTIVMDELTMLSLKIDLSDLGAIKGNSSVCIEISNVSRSGTPKACLYDLTTGLDEELVNIDSNLFLYVPRNIDDPLLKFSDFSNLEWKILCGIGSAITVRDIGFFIEYYPYKLTNEQIMQRIISEMDLPGIYAPPRKKRKFKDEAYLFSPINLAVFDTTATYRKYGSWITSTRANTIADPTVIQDGQIYNPVGVIESIIQDEIKTRWGFSTLSIDTDSFDVAYDLRPAANWQFMFSQTEQIKFRDMINALALNCACKVWINYLNIYKIKAFNPNPNIDYYFFSEPTIESESYNYGRIIRPDELELEPVSLENIFDSFRINYQFDYWRGGYEENVYVNASSSNWTDIDDSDAILNCSYVHSLYHIENKEYQFDARYIYDKETAERLCNHLCLRMSKRFYITTFITGLEGMIIEPWDCINIRHPLIVNIFPATYMSKKWLVLNISSNGFEYEIKAIGL